MGKHLLKGLLGLVLGGVLLAGLLLVGAWVRRQLAQQPDQTLSWSDLDCAPPPGLSRRDFLEEVQYLGSLPAQLPLWQKDLAEQLAQAFARHPWVARVEKVEVLPGGPVRVHLVYRQPVLAVRVGGQLRAVDAQGILLPPSAPTAGLPVFPGQAAPPAGPAGTPWGDPAVEQAARAVSQKQKSQTHPH
jgi:hypothetical protein